MHNVNDYLLHLKSNLLLVAVAAVLFFIAKAITGYCTYKHYDKKFKKIEDKIDELLRR